MPQILAGKKFVLTGSLPRISRPDASEIIRKFGGSVSGSVSKKTHFLIYGEDAGSKYDKAMALGVECLDEDEMRKMII